jgi:hypothetical protein
MNDELERILKEAVLTQRRYYRGGLEGLRKTTNNLSIVGVYPEIQTQNLHYTSLERCH